MMPVEHPQLRPSQTRTRGCVSGAWLDETPIAVGGVPCDAPEAGVATTARAWHNFRLKPSTEWISDEI
jgi:hypothetical protein